MRRNVFRKRLDVHDALAHPWVQLADNKGEGELLTTQFLKEFKYRHQWVVSGASFPSGALAAARFYG